jgi:hypothetical protein
MQDLQVLWRYLAYTESPLRRLLPQGAQSGAFPCITHLPSVALGQPRSLSFGDVSRNLGLGLDSADFSIR